MSNYVRSAAYATSKALAEQKLKVKRSQVLEVVAALLGYGTYAALVTEEANPQLDYHIEDAEIVVLNLKMGEWRVFELVLEEGSAASNVTAACIAALKAGTKQAAVYEGVADFYDSDARKKLAETIYNSDELAGALAESNASYPDEPEMQVECPKTEDLWAARVGWTITADGNMTGEYDSEGDRMFNGKMLNCRGWLTYRKAGRAGLVFVDSGGIGGADDSWRDLDREAELEYAKSLQGKQGS